MQWCWVACVILLAGGVSSSFTPKPVDVTIGDDFELYIEEADVEKCFLVSPAGDTIELAEEESFGRYQLREPPADFGCFVMVSDAGEGDDGLWEIHAVMESGTEISDTFAISVTQNDLRLQLDDAVWYPLINYTARHGIDISMTLSRTAHDEECYLRPPGDNFSRAKDLNMPGVRVYQSSEYVSCRVVIGPMDDTLAGSWDLCGSYVDDGVPHVRCQPGLIGFNNTGWEPLTLPHFSHFVHFDMNLFPSVRGTGNIQTCHIITPNGEDLVVAAHTDYPGITRVNSNTICNVTIGPIHEGLLGEWTVYAVFNGNRGFNEVRQPVDLMVYDIYNPYNQAYNVSTLETHKFLGNIGGTILANVTFTSGSIVNCYFHTPSGEVYDRQNVTNQNEVFFEASSNNRECRIRIGPITASMLGDWQLIAKWSNNVRFNESRLPFRIIEEGIIDRTDPNVTWLRQIEFSALRGSEVSITLNRTQYDEKCFIRTPQDVPIGLDELQMDGVRGYGSSDFVSCGAVIGPMDVSLLGIWALCGEHVEDELEHIVRCQPIRIIWHNNSTNATYATIPGFDHAVHFGMILSPLVRGTGNVQTCHIITPNGEDLIVDQQSSYRNITRVSTGLTICNISLGPIHSNMLGEWTIYGRFFGNRGFNEIRQTVNIFLYDENDPYHQAFNVSTLQPINSLERLGDTLVLHINGSGTINNCTLRLPSGDVVHNMSSLNGVSFVSTNRVECRVSIGPITQSMFGDWQLSGLFRNGIRFNETRLPFTIIQEASIDQNDDEEWLPQIEYSSLNGEDVSITLSRTDNEEECYLRTPEDEAIELDKLNMSRVEGYGSSEFVSCGVVIGPMDASLLGLWVLCGAHHDDESRHVRCQPVRIVWNNNSTNATWVTQPGFNHAVHFGMTLTPMVRGTGNVQTCHVVTPNGEDLLVTEESTYPNITRAALRELTFCSIAIGPVHSSMLGEWTIYGRFVGNRGFNEIRQPLNFYLYDEYNPYNQAYNVTTLLSSIRVVNLDTMIEMVVNGTGSTDNCYIETPSGQFLTSQNSSSLEGISFVPGNNRDIECRITIGPITPEMVGEWRLTGKFSNNGRFDERRQPFIIMQEDPANPIEDNDRTVEPLIPQRFDTSIGARHAISMAVISRRVVESCHIRTPDGLQYTIMAGFNVSGVQPLTGNNIACGVTVDVLTKELIGDWVLITRENSGVGIERRLPFTIYVEEPVGAVPAVVTIAEGNDFYIRLEQPTEFYKTCTLLRPNGHEADVYKIDEAFTKFCGFIVKDIGLGDNGGWVIRYENKIVYRGTTIVTVKERFFTKTDEVVLRRDRHVDQVIGPENSIYCRVENPHGITIFEGFGRCRIILERATPDHTGLWRMIIGAPGHVVAEKHEFFVNVTEAESKASVATHVEVNYPTIFLSCSLSTDYVVRACKFRDPTGRLLLANNGVGEDRYRSHGVEVSLQTDIHSHDCRLWISNPEPEDMGLWRCAVETDSNTYFGFLTVLSPHYMSMPAVAESVVSNPTLSADESLMSLVEGDSVNMTCSVQSTIRYCYFRAPNGTTFNVSPGSRTLEYVGAGFDAGECGIRFLELQARDSGLWSCHIGFPEVLLPEQRAIFTVEVHEPMVATQLLRQNEDEDYLVVEGTIYKDRQLDYCRFVRIDGTGFTQNNMPDNYRYASNSSLSEGFCSLHIRQPSILDLHPWTVVAMIRGQVEEIVRVTTSTFPEPEPEPKPEPEPEPEEDGPIASSSSFPWVWILVMVLAVLVIFVAVLLGPKTTRRWTFSRASAFRNSLRRSLRKQPLPDNDVNPNPVPPVSVPPAYVN